MEKSHCLKMAKNHCGENGKWQTTTVWVGWVGWDYGPWIKDPLESSFEKYLRNISQDCAGESQSPIDVEWPEDTLANAQPSQLNFEGYERVSRFILHKL